MRTSPGSADGCVALCRLGDTTGSVPKPVRGFSPVRSCAPFLVAWVWATPLGRSKPAPLEASEGASRLHVALCRLGDTTGSGARAVAVNGTPARNTTSRRCSQVTRRPGSSDRSDMVGTVDESGVQQPSLDGGRSRVERHRLRFMIRH